MASSENGREGIALKTRDRRLANQPDISPLDVEKLLVLYRACVQNAEELLNESVLLAEHAKYHRATFLAITAYEEMGKAHLVADYADNVVSAGEFKKAFESHPFKVAYMNRFLTLEAAGPLRPKLKGDETITLDYRPTKYLGPLRQQALYVHWQDAYDNLKLPIEITKAHYDDIFERAQEFFDEIDHAEWLNGRIGSRALFK
jgi:AbiV family abortive infection protein